jgi:hypothetical protein
MVQLVGRRLVACDPDFDFCNLCLEVNIMSRSRSLVKAYGPKAPVTLARIFGPPPLVGNEDPNLYRELFTLIADEYDPKTIGDWLLVKDMADLHWERLRERRLKAEVIKIYLEQPPEGSNQPTIVISAADARL